MGSMGKRLAAALLALAVATGVMATGAGAQTKASPDAKPVEGTVKLSIGTSATLNAAPLFIAQAKGYFAKEHLDVSIVSNIVGIVAQPLLATGRMDAAYVGASVAFFNGVAGGHDVKFASGAGQTKIGCKPTCAGSGFVVQRNGPIKKLSDLRGKKIAANGGFTGTSGYYLSQLLKQAGMTPDDVRVVDILLPDGLQALNNGAVSAAIDSGVGMTQHISSGGPYDLIGDMDKVLANGNGGGFIFGKSLIKENRRAGVAVIRAMLKAVRVDLKGDWVHDKEIVNILSKATGTPTWVIKASPVPVFDNNLAQTTQVLADMQSFWRFQGKLLNYAPSMKPPRYSDSGLLADAVASYK
jgi:NitT/TauT family transport system substrate-binding protein